MALSNHQILDSFKKEIPCFTTMQDGRVMYTDEYKSSIIKFHYKSGMSISAISAHIDIDQSLLSKWKRKYGSERTAFVHGQSIRNDLRTKALCVKELVEDKKTNKELLATKYNVSQQTVQAWFYKFRNNYQELLDTAIDGIPYLVSQEKHIYGNKNIEMFFQKLEEEYEHINALLQAQHLSVDEKTILKQMQKKNTKTKEKATKALEELKEAGVEL